MIVFREKVCPGCDKLLHTTTENFGLRPNEDGDCGLKSLCRICLARKSKEWRKQNPQKYRDAKNRWQRANPETRPHKKLMDATRQSQYRHLKKKTRHTMELVGLSGEEWMEYLMSINDNPMITPENYGKVWHVDHIFPLSLAYDDAHREQLYHYLNTQPMLALDNQRKTNKVILTEGSYQPLVGME